jgi:hypothetical protein
MPLIVTLVLSAIFMVGCERGTYTTTCDNGFKKTAKSMYIQDGVVYWENSVYRIPDGVTCRKQSVKDIYE